VDIWRRESAPISDRIHLDQWSSCFEWPENAQGPSNVEIVDYR
jgi:plasmid maintenance system killer protein